MRYLVDANILSEATKPAPDPAVVEWLGENELDIVIDPIILGELRFGILRLPKGRRRSRLERWFETGIQRIHCLAWEPAFGLRWAQLLADLRSSGDAMSIKDSLIATTALVHDLTLVTHNKRDFAKACPGLLDPFGK